MSHIHYPETGVCVEVGDGYEMIKETCDCGQTRYIREEYGDWGKDVN